MKVFSMLETGTIRPLDSNPRKTFDEQALSELEKSIESRGIIQPLVVRANGDGYDLVAGERRWRCAQRLGLVEVPCIVSELNDVEVAEIQLLENIDRNELNPLEESVGVCRLVELGVHPRDVAGRIGRASDWVQLRLDLPTLPEPAKDALVSGRISLGGAKQILKVDANARDEATQRLLELEGHITERAVAEILRNRYHEPRKRRKAWEALKPQMVEKFGDSAAAIEDVERSYEYVRAWGAGIGHYVNASHEVGGLSRHPVESIITWSELAHQHSVPTLLVCAGGDISIDAVVEVVDRRVIVDAERALREQGKPHTLGPRKSTAPKEADEPEEPDAGEGEDDFIIRHLMQALELRHDDEELRELLMPVLELIAERK